MRDAAAGAYVPGSSPVHALDPRAKVMVAAALIVAAFASSSARDAALVCAAVVVLVVVAGVGVPQLLRALRPVALVLGLLSVVQAFIGGAPHVALGPVLLSQPGIERASLLLVQVVAIVVVTTLVTATTSPARLAAGLEALLAPLRVVRVPVGDLALVLTIAFGFIPAMSTELASLERAQRARGAEPEDLGVSMRLRMKAALLVPLVVMAFRRARLLADAMHLRGYRRDGRRTRYRPLRLGVSDVAWALLAMAVPGAILL